MGFHAVSQMNQMREEMREFGDIDGLREEAARTKVRLLHPIDTRGGDHARALIAELTKTELARKRLLLSHRQLSGGGEPFVDTHRVLSEARRPKQHAAQNCQVSDRTVDSPASRVGDPARQRIMPTRDDRRPNRSRCALSSPAHATIASPANVAEVLGSRPPRSRWVPLSRGGRRLP